MADVSGAISIGVAAALGPEAIGRVARLAEEAGFAAVWVNDTPGADAVTALAAAARTTDRIRLCTGVLPVDRRPAASVVRDVRAAGLPPERLVLGLGAGGLRRGALEAVGDAAGAAKSELGCRVLVGALGPRMRHLGAELADGVLLSWLTPIEADRQAREAHDVDASASAALYVRTALDEAALPRLREETARYASYPAYRANAERLGIDFADTVLPSGDQQVSPRLGAYRSVVDEVVLRAIVASDDIDAYASFIARAAAAAGIAA